MAGTRSSTKSPIPRVSSTLLAEEGRSADEALFVGDSRVDLETARNAGVRSCLVSYGIRPKASAAREPDFRSDFQIENMRELTAIVGVGA